MKTTKQRKAIIDGFEVSYVPLPAEKEEQYKQGLRILTELARRYKAKRVAEGTWNVEPVEGNDDEKIIPSA